MLAVLAVCECSQSMPVPNGPNVEAKGETSAAFRRLKLPRPSAHQVDRHSDIQFLPAAV